MAEFLPICDILFNVISLAGYFCDVVFDVVLSYALFERGRFMYFTVVITLVMASLIISQVSGEIRFSAYGETKIKIKKLINSIRPLSRSFHCDGIYTKFVQSTILHWRVMHSPTVLIRRNQLQLRTIPAM